MTTGSETNITWERDSIDASRLKAFCAARTRVCEVTGCWIWTGSKRTTSRRVKNSDVRGRLKINGREQYAYRVVWSLTHERPFPEGAKALHSCDRPECVNPEHVRPGTSADNANDAAVRGRMKSRLTDEQVAAIVRVAHGNVGATPTTIVKVIGDPTINRWNVRDVVKHGLNVRRVNARAASSLQANLAMT